MASSLLEKANQVRRGLVEAGYDAARVDEAFDKRFPLVSTLDADSISAAMRRDLGEPTGKPSASKSGAASDGSGVSPVARQAVEQRQKQAEGMKTWGIR